MKEADRHQIAKDCTPEESARDAGCAHCAVRQRMLFAEVDVDAASALLQSVTHKKFPPTKPIYSQGEKPSAIISVRHGIVKLSKISPKGILRIVRLVGPGGTIGLEALLDEPYHHYAEPLTRADVCLLPIATIRKLAREQPRLQEKLMGKWAEQITSADDYLLHLSTGSIRARLLHLIGILASLCEKVETDFVLPSNPDCAALVAARVESVSREIAEFKRSGLLVKSAAGNWRPAPDAFEEGC